MHKSTGCIWLIVLLWVGVSCMDLSSFGHDRLDDFMLGKNYTNFNAGSFGNSLRAVVAKQREQYDLAEAEPDPWFRSTYRTIVSEVREAVAKYLGAQSRDLVLVENTSAGVNAVLRSLSASLPLRHGSSILTLSTAYPMVPNTLAYLGEELGFTSRIVGVEFPFTPDAHKALVEAVRKEIAAHKDTIKLCIFSHITSVPAVVLNLTELVPICQAAGIPVLIDGAHAPGQIDIDLTHFESLGVSYYVGNFHKWMYTAKGTAFLWTTQSRQDLLAPTVISSEFIWDYSSEFLYTGTRDYTAFTSIPVALDYRQRLGDAAIKRYMNQLLNWSADYLTKLWGTELLVDTTYCAAMLNIYLPPTCPYGDEFTAALLEREGMYLLSLIAPTNAHLPFTRISMQIYLQQSDIIRLGEAVKALCV